MLLASGLLLRKKFFLSALHPPLRATEKNRSVSGVRSTGGGRHPIADPCQDDTASEEFEKLNAIGLAQGCRVAEAQERGIWRSGLVRKAGALRMPA